MFLETGKIKLQTNEVIFIHVEISINKLIKKYWLRGIVVRRNNDGIGIRYSDIQSNAWSRDLEACRNQATVLP